MMTTPVFRLRQNLALVLKERRITAAQLSRQSGIAKQVLSDWLAGVQPRKLEQLYAVARILKVNLEKLCFADSTQALLETEKETDKEADKEVNTASEGSSIHFDEIRGRFEVYLRRITGE
jgi:transcriptional regulator with XRE-family HTH domain